MPDIIVSRINPMGGVSVLLSIYSSIINLIGQPLSFFFSVAADELVQRL